MTTFTDLGLAAPLLKALAAEGYENPTPIQAQAIPYLLEGRDLLGIAQTGTGKTAAFALPILNKLAAENRRPNPRSCRALILSPTRELAGQIGQSLKTYGKFLKLSHATVFGGVSIGGQIRTLQQGVDCLVATPGRLADLIDRRALSLADVQVFVLDEADQMLDLGFIHAIRRVVGLLPKTRQNLFFSATMPKEIAGLASDLLREPARVEVTPVATTAERVEQHVIHVEQRNKLPLLVDLLKDKSISRTLVFARTKHGADKITKGLVAASVGAAAIHGNKSQGQRERALSDFKRGTIRVLVATDIAARGIDVEAVSHVFNHDLPNVPESYVHRIGRTARAGNSGIAISFCDTEERGDLRGIERLTRQSINVMEHALSLPTPAPGERVAPAKKRGGGGRPNNGGRPAQNGRPAFGGRDQRRSGEGRGAGDRFGNSSRDQGHRGENRAAGDRTPGHGHFASTEPLRAQPRRDEPRRQDHHHSDDRPHGERGHHGRDAQRHEPRDARRTPAAHAPKAGKPNWSNKPRRDGARSENR